MTRHTHLMILPLLTAALIAGCGSTPKTTSTTSPADPPPAAEPSLTVEEVFGDDWNSSAQPRQAAFSSPSTNALAAIETSPTSSDPHNTRDFSLIGLYGEGIVESDSTDIQRPGRANLAQISFASEGACFDPAINRQGTLIAFASTMHRATSDIYIKSVSGTTVTQITSDPGDDVMPAFHPDGRQIAFASNRNGNWDIYISSVDGGAAVKITDDPDPEIHPSFSPDGRMLAYCKLSSQSGRWEIWAVDIENPGVRQFLEYGMFPQWSPDVANSKILFQRPRQRGSRLHGIWTIDYRNGEAINPTEIVSAANAAVINPSWSPDGKRIVFVSVIDPETAERPDQSDIWVINVDGSSRAMLTDNQFANFQPVWATDGRVYFVSNRSGVDNIWSISTGRATDNMPPRTDYAGVDVNYQP